MNADGSNEHVLTTEDSPLNFFAAWSPDGSQIVFTAGSGDAIDVMNADGSGRHRLVTKLAGETYGHLSWSPDGGRIAVETTRPQQAGSDDRFEIWVMNADGSDLTRLTNNTVPDHHPAWRPDGTRIAFATRRGATPVNVFLISPDGSGEAQLTHDFFGVLGGPAWSHDGQQIAFSGFTGITVANADGSNPTTVPGTNVITDFDFK
jgi:TolB protein